MKTIRCKVGDLVLINSKDPGWKHVNGRTAMVTGRPVEGDKPPAADWLIELRGEPVSVFHWQTGEAIEVTEIGAADDCLIPLWNADWPTEVVDEVEDVLFEIVCGGSGVTA